MITTLRYDGWSAALVDEVGTVLRAFGWKPGGHVRETIGAGNRTRNVGVCYAGKSTGNTIIAEDDPAETARHIAAVCRADRIAPR